LITGSGASGMGDAGLTGCVCAETAAIAGIRSNESTATRETRCRPAGVPRSALPQCSRFASSLKERVLNEQILKGQILA
jgi:hypothetical protein